MSVFSAEVKMSDQNLTVVLSGSVNETAVFPEVELNGIQSLYVDFELVTSINSIGIHTWINWVESTISSDGLPKLVLRKVPRAIMDQANSVKGFVPKNYVIESLFVPFYCAVCSGEKSILFKVGDEIKISANESVVIEKDEICHDQKMEMDVLSQSYFRLLKPIV